MSNTSGDLPAESRDHPAVSRLRAAVAAALKGRERKLKDILEHDRRRAEQRRNGQSLPQLSDLLWHHFAKRAHDLSAHAPGAVKASPEGADAALAILQVLCDTAVTRGWSVKATPDGCWLVMSGEELKVRVTVRERFAPGELRRDTPTGIVREKAKTGTGRFTLVLVGEGLTELKVEGTADELQHKIRTAAVFERMGKRLHYGRRREAAAAARQRERERRDVAAMEARKEEERQRMAVALEAERREKLRRQAAAWEDAERIRRYVSHALEAGADPAWREWALQVANDVEAAAGPTPRSVVG